MWPFPQLMVHSDHGAMGTQGLQYLLGGSRWHPEGSGKPAAPSSGLLDVAKSLKSCTKSTSRFREALPDLDLPGLSNSLSLSLFHTHTLKFFVYTYFSLNYCNLPWQHSWQGRIILEYLDYYNMFAFIKINKWANQKKSLLLIANSKMKYYSLMLGTLGISPRSSKDAPLWLKHVFLLQHTNIATFLENRWEDLV